MERALNGLIDLAFAEDIGPGDITTESLVEPHRRGRGFILAKEDLILAGLDAARQVFLRLDPEVGLSSEFEDGEPVRKGTVIAEVNGRLSALLRGERIALNFLQRLSGIATLTRTYVDRIQGEKVRLVDTRKTAPGWRALEKYAVRMGGAFNHRMGLYDGVLIKDNHIAVAGGVGAAVERVRDRVSHLVKIEVEAADMEQVEAALDAGADVIMLDNMSVDEIRAAVEFIGGRALVEISGGVNLERLKELAGTGADLISCGALTHGARSVDISMRISDDSDS